jgi:chemotaxis protein MotB
MARGKPRGRYTPTRRGGQQSEDTSNRWLTTYADAITLLMAFFIMLYAMSEIDVLKFTAFIEGLRVPFGNEAGDGLMPATDGLQPDLEPRPDGEPIERPELPERVSEAMPEPPERTDADERAELLEQAAARAEAEANLDAVAAALTEALEAEGLELLVEQRREERGLVVSIAADDVLFALGSTRISSVGRDVIRVVSETLNGYPNPLQVEGHTDDVPLARSGYTNWNLSTDRAVAVLELMIERHGLPPYQVGAVGFGEYRPLADNAQAAGRQRNRRVDIVVLLEEVRT